MALPAFAEALFGGLEATTKRVLVEFVRYALPNTKFGPITHQAKTESFTAYYSTLTTPASTATELSVQHGMGRAPYLAKVLVPLDSSGYTAAVLVSARPADAMRAYFRAKAGSTGQKCAIYLE